jgi:ketosteroid isomerase-like protein
MSETTVTDITSTVDTWLEAYAEPDAARRAELVARVWADDGLLADPPFDARGREQITAMGDTVLAHFPGHRFRRTSGIDLHHGTARYAWEIVSPEGNAVLYGLDVADVDETGRLTRVVGFFGDLPADA